MTSRNVGMALNRHPRTEQPTRCRVSLSVRGEAAPYRGGRSERR